MLNGRAMGDSFYFMNVSDVLRVRIADHKVEKVVSLMSLHLKFGSGLSLTPDDSSSRAARDCRPRALRARLGSSVAPDTPHNRHFVCFL